MSDQLSENALTVLRKALEKAGLEGVVWCDHPGHVLIQSKAGDFVIWAQAWGDSARFKLEGPGMGDSHRFGNVKLTVSAVRDLTSP